MRRKSELAPRKALWPLKNWTDESTLTKRNRQKSPREGERKLSKSPKNRKEKKREPDCCAIPVYAGKTETGSTIKRNQMQKK
jgi:hypothetical protein